METICFQVIGSGMVELWAKGLRAEVAVARTWGREADDGGPGNGEVCLRCLGCLR
jgi:hypothetical protein